LQVRVAQTFGLHPAVPGRNDILAGKLAHDDWLDPLDFSVPIAAVR